MKANISNRGLLLLLGVIVAVVVGLTVWYYGGTLEPRSQAEPLTSPKLHVRAPSLFKALPQPFRAYRQP